MIIMNNIVKNFREQTSLQVNKRYKLSEKLKKEIFSCNLDFSKKT